MAEIPLPAEELLALRNEIKLSEKFNEQELEPRMNESIERYSGRHLPMIAADWSIILNEIYPVVQYNLPAIFFRNPKVFLKPRNKYFFAKRRNPLTGQIEKVQLDSTKSANTQAAILNYIMDQIRYKQETRKTLLDALLFPHGILWHGYKGNFGFTDEHSLYIESEQIYVLRVSPHRFIHDPSVSIEDIEQARWIGRWSWARLEEVLEDDALDVDKKQLKGTLGYGERIGLPLSAEPKGGSDVIQLGSSRLRALIEYADDDFKRSPKSKFLKLYEIFKRPTPKERREGERGKVIVLNFEQTRPMRVNSWAYDAKGWPAKILQFNPVPNQKIGLADLDVYGSIADHKNLVINQQIRNAEQNNKLFVAVAKDGADEEDIEKMRRGENSVIQYDTENVQNKMFVASGAGAASAELYLLDTRIDKNLQDKSGVTDLKRGILTSGEESKFSVQQRAAGGAARPAYRQDIMSDFLKESCLYVNELIKQYFPIEEAVRIVGSLDIEWSEQPSKEDIQAEVDVELDVISMLPENPEKELQELTTILNMMIETLNNPNVYQKIQQEGKIFNIAPIIEQMLLRLKIRDPEVFRTIKPEETQGYVEVAELRAAQANVDAVLRNQPPPSPPQPGQNHQARLEIYGAIAQLLREVGSISDGLDNLIRVQLALLQTEQEKEGQVGQPLRPQKPFLQPITP